MPWWRVIFVLCVFGFLKEFRPSEAFISPFLNGPWKNFTEAEINQDIFPVSTYSSLSLLIVVFLLTDLLRYKPIIILEGFAGIITWSLMTFGQGIYIMQISQFFYGLFTVTEVAYFSYMYAKIDKKHYQRATSQTKTALLAGKASSGLISQILVTLNVMDYEQLNYLTLGALISCTLWAFVLPPVGRSTYFHRLESSNLSQSIESEHLEIKVLEAEVEAKAIDHGATQHLEQNVKSFLPAGNFSYIAQDLKTAFRNEHVIKWSLFWALSMCGYLQITYYMQLLWQTVINEGDSQQHIYHGISNCAHSLLGAVCTYLVGYVRLNWDVYGELALALCSLLQGALICYCSNINHLISGYIFYVIFRILYQASNTIASSEIAKHIPSDSYGLVFGINTFIALVGQCVITVVAIDWLKLDIRTQFMIYGAYYLVIAVGFTIAAIITLGLFCMRKQKIPS